MKKDKINPNMFNDIKFFSVAEGGAMGCPGELIFISGNGYEFRFNFVYGGTRLEDIIEAFPLLGECSFGLFGEDSSVPDGWNYVNLGMGNHLVVKDDVYPEFAKRVGSFEEPSHVYTIWENNALRVLGVWPEGNIEITDKGITGIPADCIVNAANSSLMEGGGVCGIIFKKAGSSKLTAACNAIGHCETGSAVITPAFNLKAKYIIHAVGPVYQGGKHGEASMLYDCYKKSLELAMENDCHSIVFPLISTGIFGYPKEEAWRKAIRACTNFINKYPTYKIDIKFAVPDDNIRSIGYDTLFKIEEEKRAAIDKKVSSNHESKPENTDPRAERIEVFNDTQQWIKINQQLTDAVKLSKKKTYVYYENDYPDYKKDKNASLEISVTRARTFEAAMRLSKDNPGLKIAVLNFANAFHAGGGVTKGASAQEESLCRCSTLYPCIYRRTLRDTFYKHHKDLDVSIRARATDSLIYTEDVIICKTDDDHPVRMDEKDWVKVDVISLAAPDLRKKSNIYAEVYDNGTSMNDAELFGYHVKRAIHMLTVVASKNVDVLVLGAFGCGAFENNPEVVARAYKVALKEFPKVFKRIEFAIYGTKSGDVNYEVFKRVLLQENVM